MKLSKNQRPENKVYFNPYFIFSNLNHFSLDICPQFLINKNNNCKKKSYNIFNRGIERISDCICHDLNVKPTWTNSTLENLANLQNSYIILPFKVYFKIKKPIILNKKLSICDGAFLNISIKYRLFISRVGSSCDARRMRCVARRFFWLRRVVTRRNDRNDLWRGSYSILLNQSKPQ